MTLPLLRGVDPTTPGEELAAIALTFRHPEAEAARRNPALPSEDIRRWVAANDVSIWDNPALPLVLLEGCTPEMRLGAAGAAVKRIAVGLPLTPLLVETAQAWWEGEVELQRRLLIHAEHAHGTGWGGVLHRAYGRLVAAVVRAWSPHLPPTKARFLLAAAASLHTWPWSGPEVTDDSFRRLERTHDAWSTSSPEWSIANGLLGAIGAKESTAAISAAYSLSDPGPRLTRTPGLRQAVSQAVAATLPRFPPLFFAAVAGQGTNGA